MLPNVVSKAWRVERSCESTLVPAALQGHNDDAGQ